MAGSCFFHRVLLEAVSEKEPLDQHGGLFAFDLDCYKKEMKSTLRYECLVCFTEIPLLSFTHRALAPTLGQFGVFRCAMPLSPISPTRLFFLACVYPSAGAIRKMALAHWTGADGKWAFKSWADAVVVRAVSKSERPAPPSTLNGDAYRP